MTVVATLPGYAAMGPALVDLSILRITREELADG
jgi:hypothetical protein